MTTVQTKGQFFNNIKTISTRAVQFDIQGKGHCVIGFAKDRNAFMEAFNGTIKEVTKNEVIKRMSAYQGSDAAKLVKLIKQTKPVTMAAGTCQECSAELSQSVRNYSMEHFGKSLCRAHQPKRERSERTTQPNQSPKPSQSPKYEWIEQTFDCERCGATGYMRPYDHVAGGVCFKCNGNKKYTRKVRVDVSVNPNQAARNAWSRLQSNIDASRGPSASEAPSHRPQAEDIVFSPTYVGICDVCDMGECLDVQLFYSDKLNHHVCLGCASEAEYEYREEEQSVHNTNALQTVMPDLGTWWSPDNRRYSSRASHCGCDCGGTVRWVKDAGSFGCESCYTFMTTEAFTTLVDEEMNAQDARFQEELAADRIKAQEEALARASARKKCNACGNRRKVNINTGLCTKCAGPAKTHNAEASDISSAERPAAEMTKQEQPQDGIVTADSVESLL